MCPRPGEGGDIPVARYFVVAQDVTVTVVGLTSKPAALGGDPAVDNLQHLHAAFAEIECTGLLLPSITSVAFDANRHGV